MPPLLLSPFVLAELDYLLATQVGEEAQLGAPRRGRARRLPTGTLQRSGRSPPPGHIMRRYSNLAIGLADASIVVLAERHGTRDVLTLDERHFRTSARGGGKRFRLLPADR